MAKLSKRSLATKKAWKTRRAKTIVVEEINMLTRRSVKSIADEMDEALTNLENALITTTKRISSILKKD